MARPRPDITHRIAAGIVALVGAALLAASCGSTAGGRFPVCKTNEDCKPIEGATGVVCYDLRCVECQYDSHCPTGYACTRQNSCISLRDPGAEPIEDDKKDAGGGEPATLDQCLTRCETSQCLERCNKQFKEPE